jgi:hypothetical protein
LNSIFHSKKLILKKTKRRDNKIDREEDRDGQDGHGQGARRYELSLAFWGSDR